jgi:hypothetical protein
MRNLFYVLIMCILEISRAHANQVDFCCGGVTCCDNECNVYYCTDWSLSCSGFNFSQCSDEKLTIKESHQFLKGYFTGSNYARTSSGK